MKKIFGKNMTQDSKNWKGAFMYTELSEIARLVKAHRVRLVDVNKDVLVEIQQCALDAKDLELYNRIDVFIQLTNKVKYRLTQAI